MQKAALSTTLTHKGLMAEIAAEIATVSASELEIGSTVPFPDDAVSSGAVEDDEARRFWITSRRFAELLSTAQEEEARLAVPRQIRFGQRGVDFGFRRTVEHRRDRPEAELRAGPAEMRFQNLTHVHTAWHAQRVEHDLNRRAVLQIRHIFDR